MFDRTSTSYPPPGTYRPNANHLQGERRVITMLFCDVVNSTNLASQFDPEEWVEIMNEAYSYMIAPVEKFEGSVARLMGDGLLAFFGAPVAHEDDPQRAIFAGLEIAAGIRQFRKVIQHEYGLDFNVRIGINTGPVVVGEVGSHQSLEYTAMGDAINIASRMESTAVPGTVQISEDTYRLVAPLFDVWEVGEIEVKGKEEPLRAYRVLGMADQPGSLRGIQGRVVPLIGREDTIGLLTHIINCLSDQQTGCIVFLTGEAGLGKTRLLDELRRTALAALGSLWSTSRDNAGGEAESHSPKWATSPVWASMSAMSFNANEPYGMFRHQLRQLNDVRISDTPEQILARLDESVRLFPPDLHQRVRPVLAALLGIRLSPVNGYGSRGAEEQGSRAAVASGQSAASSGQLAVMESPNPQSPISNSPGFQLGDESFRRELFAVMRETAEMLLQRGPVVYIVDDLHWADSASIELYRHLLQVVEKHRALFLFAMRPERETAAWQLKEYAQAHYPDKFQEVRLEPLTAGQSVSLVSQLLDIAEIPQPFQEQILRKADGNPFFIEEVVRTLLDGGLIKPGRGGQHAQLDANFDPRRVNLIMPDSVQALLAARIDRLDPDTRHILQLASVIGRTFDVQVLYQLTNNPDDVNQKLERLREMDFVLPLAGQKEMTYIFHHELTRDAAYESILRRQRRLFHRHVGEALEHLYRDKLEEHAAILAQHFVRAADRPRALRYFTMAGESAAALYANLEAADYFSQAIELALLLPENDPALNEQLIALYVQRGRVLEQCGLFQKALDNYQELEAIGRKRELPQAELVSLILQATIYITPTSKQNAKKGHEIAARMLALAESLNDYRAQARSYWNLLLLNSHLTAQPAEALEYGEKGLAIATAHGLDNERAYILHDMARVYQSLGRLEMAHQRLIEAKSLWRVLGNQPMLADNLGTLAQNLILAGKSLRAIPLAEEGYRISKTIGNLWGQSFNSFMLGMAYCERGYFSRAVEAYFRAAELGWEAGFSLMVRYVPMLITWICGMVGSDPQSSGMGERFRLLEEKAAEQESHWSIMRTAIGQYYRGDVDGAYEVFCTRGPNFLTIAETTLAAPYLKFLAGQIALAGGRPDQALEFVEPAIYWGQTTELRVYLPDLLHVQGAAQLEMGKTKAGHAALLDAYNEARRQRAYRALLTILITLHQEAVLQGNEDAAERAQREGRRVVALICRNIEQTAVRHAFLNLPGVRELAPNLSP